MTARGLTISLDEIHGWISQKAKIQSEMERLAVELSRLDEKLKAVFVLHPEFARQIHGGASATMGSKAIQNIEKVKEAIRIFGPGSPKVIRENMVKLGYVPLNYNAFSVMLNRATERGILSKYKRGLYGIAGDGDQNS